MAKHYSVRLKATVLQQINICGRPVAQVSKELGAARSTIYGWLKEEKKVKEVSKEKFIITKLEQKLKRVTDERDVLIQAVSILARL